MYSSLHGAYLTSHLFLNTNMTYPRSKASPSFLALTVRKIKSGKGPGIIYDVTDIEGNEHRWIISASTHEIAQLMVHVAVLWRELVLVVLLEH